MADNCPTASGWYYPSNSVNKLINKHESEKRKFNKMSTANTYHIAGKFKEATEVQEEAWQAVRDALSDLADAYGIDYDGLITVDATIEDAISDLLT